MCFLGTDCSIQNKEDIISKYACCLHASSVIKTIASIRYSSNCAFHAQDYSLRFPCVRLFLPMYTKTQSLYNTPPHWCVVVHRSASLHGIRGSGQSPSWSLHPSTASHLPFSATLLPQKLHREPITARPSHQPPRTSHYCMPCPAPCPSRALPPLPRQPPPLRQTPVGCPRRLV